MRSAARRCLDGFNMQPGKKQLAFMWACSRRGLTGGLLSGGGKPGFAPGIPVILSGADGRRRRQINCLHCRLSGFAGRVCGSWFWHGGWRRLVFVYSFIL